jgi:signal recognition particle GTPase
MPSFLYTSLVNAADQHCLDFQQELRISPLSWHPSLLQFQDQLDASYLEHLYTSQKLQQAIDNFISGGPTSPSSVIIIGGPGTGKTFQINKLVYMLCLKG